MRRLIGLLAATIGAACVGFVLSVVLVNLLHFAFGTGGKHVLPQGLWWLDHVAMLPTLALPTMVLIMCTYIDNRRRKKETPTTGCSPISNRANAVRKV